MMVFELDEYDDLVKYDEHDAQWTPKNEECTFW